MFQPLSKRGAFSKHGAFKTLDSNKNLHPYTVAPPPRIQVFTEEVLAKECDPLIDKCQLTNDTTSTTACFDR